MAQLLKRETRAALDALAIYRNIGRGRTLKKLRTILEQEWGEESPSEGTIALWSTSFGWPERVEQWDHQIQAEQERQDAEWMLQERRRRMRRRARQTDMVAMSIEPVFFVKPEEMTDEERMQFPEGRIRSMSEVDPATAAAARQWFTEVRNTDILDFGGVTQRTEAVGKSDDGPPPAAQQIVQVFGEEARTFLWTFLNPDRSIVGDDAPALKAPAVEAEGGLIIDGETGVILEP